MIYDAADDAPKYRLSPSIRGDSTRPYLIIIQAGPIYNLERIRRHAKVLSERFQGEFWVLSKCAPVQEGRFRINTIPPTGSSILTLVRQLFYAIHRAHRLRRSLKGPFVVGSYDPLREGIVAVTVAALLRSPAWIEVNGCFGEEYNYRDSPTARPKSFRRWLYRHVASFTTHRATAVKLLFREQLDGFLTDVNPRKIHCFRNFLDLSSFGPLESEKTILFAGHPFYLKGVDTLLDAFVSISNRFPDWSLLLVGHQLDDFASPWLPHPRIAVKSAVHREAMPEIIGRSSIVVLPSRTEAMGRVLVEAAMCSKARVASRVGGTYTVIDHERDGFLIPPNDPAALASVLERLMSDSTLRQNVGAAARERALREFATERWLSDFDALVADCISIHHRTVA